MDFSGPSSPFGLRRGSLRLLRHDRPARGLPSCSLRSNVLSWVARLRPSGYAAAAFACFATIGRPVACRAVACEASEGWWSQAGSNRRPLACHASALPAELWPRNSYRLSMILSENRLPPPHQVRGRLFPDHAPPRAVGDAPGKNPEHNSGPISSLLVAADVADDVGDVLVAFFLVGDEGGIVIVVVFDGLVDLDVVFRFGNDGLDLAGILLGIGFLERHQLFSLDRLRRGFGGSGSRGCRGARGRVGAGPRRRDRRNRHHLAGVR